MTAKFTLAPWFFIRLDGEDVAGYSEIEMAIDKIAWLHDRPYKWQYELRLVDDVTDEVLYVMRQDRRGRVSEDGSIDELRERYAKEKHSESEPEIVQCPPAGQAG